METKPYTGKVSGMKTSPWLASEDLSDGGGKFKSATVKISGVFENSDVKMDGGRVEKKLYSVSFEGIPKQMIVNSGNRRTLSLLFGSTPHVDWIGKEIMLTVDTKVKFGNKITTGLRFVSPNSSKPRDLNAEIGLQEKPKPSPAVEAKPQPEATAASQEEEEIELEEIDHGDD